nr:clp protease proteolytic subunit [Haymondia wallichii]WOV67762.1 clp protease proteolytic subunit [Haymondia wallichii]WOV67845.1 clp protease proteolytic subunit [Haymondia wallichii]
MGLMVYLSIEDDSRDLYLFINSPGGAIIPGMGIFDTMQLVQPDVHTICIGLAASMASLILVGGAITERIAFPHAWVMIHQPASSLYEGPTGDFMLESDEMEIMLDTITKIYVQRTNQPAWIIADDLERDVFMSAEEAKVHGIVDLVGIE